jgi:hypothetical protein
MTFLLSVVYSNGFAVDETKILTVDVMLRTLIENERVNFPCGW